MRNNLRFLLFGAALLAGGTAWSQDHTIHVSGHLAPCDPALEGAPVEIIVYGIVSGPVSATATLNMNCYYSAEFLVPDTAGHVFVSAPCGTGVAAQDSAGYFLNPAGTAEVVIDLNCSADPCIACINMVPNGPFTATFSSCTTGGQGAYTYLWDISGGGGGGFPAADITHTFPGPGTYTVCLNVWDADGASCNTCETVYVDEQGNVSLEPPADCAACFTVVQTAPFAAVLNASCSEPPSGIYTVEWDFNPPGQWQDTIVGFTFPGPGVYTICLEMFADDGCTDEVCHDVYVDDAGNVGLEPPAACMACIITTQATAPAGPVPYTAQFQSCSTGAAPLTYLWDFGEGTTSDLPDTQYPYNTPGIHLVCLTIADGNGCTSFTCDTLVVGVDGTIGTGPLWYDCLGEVWGENTPGTACTTGNGEPGMWNADCACVPASIACEACFTVQQGQGGGMLLPFTASFTDCSSASGDIQYQWTFSDGSASTEADPVWALPQQAGWYVACLTITDSLCTSTLCDTIVVDSLGYIFDGPWLDCLGEPWGTANPGTPCTGSDGTPGTWADNCACDTGVPAPCNAGFWVMQAWQGTDSTDIGPVPFELWVWNLSYGGTGNFQFLWDFGDGTTSPEPFPTHIYASSGPYMLCLTIADDAGCTDTYCEEISVDDDGFLGMAPDGGVRSTLTVNVLQEMPTHVPEQPAWEPGTLWPNPVDERLNLQLHSSRNGQVEISIISADGRTVRSERTALTTGANLLPMEVGALPAGVYLLHFTDGRNVATMRFVKQ
ncbi:MAG: PKD domain-containing protein [Flavobacteriales bacterium]|jgi:PKD repeat protein|nr:PKD domain-containing protein [Flavobacteriales bacterium]